MKLSSINVSLPKTVSDNGNAVPTGIFKKPVEGPIAVRSLNIEGDQQADLKFHGGICKAAYAYPIEHYAHWKRELNREDFNYGQFGENLTLEGLLEDQIYVGDLLRIGSAVFEVTQPRVPCFKLGIKMGGLKEFPSRFLRSGFVGFYLRVLEEGTIKAGNEVDHIRVDPNSMSIRDIHHAMHFDRGNTEVAKKARGIAALSPGWCRKFEQRLSAAGISFEVRDHPLDSQCCDGL